MTEPKTIKTITYLNGYPCTLYVQEGLPVKTCLPTKSK